MRIKSVEIKNYRSLGNEQTKIHFNSSVVCLIGKNEVGKSNILKALSEIKFFSPVRDSFLDTKNQFTSDEHDVGVNIDIELSCEDLAELCSEFSLPHIDKPVVRFEFFRHITGVCGMQFNGVFSEILEKDDLLMTTCTELAEYLGVVPGISSNSDVQNIRKCLLELSTIYTPFMTKEPLLNRYRGDAKIAEQGKIIREGLVRYYGVFEKILPKFLLFQNVLLKDSYSINELGDPRGKKDIALERYLSSIDSNLESFSNACASQSKNEIIRLRNSFQIENDKLSVDFNNWQDVGKIRLSTHFTPSECCFAVNDEGCTKTFSLSDRSSGLNWLLNVHMEIKRAKTPKNVVLLIDEPATALHVNMQKNVLNALDNISKTMQIVYTTHSPYMIDTNKLSNIRGVVKTNGVTSIRELTALATDGGDKETLTTLHRALGCDLRHNIGPILDKTNLIVEGMSDFYYLKVMLDVCGFATEKQPSIIPCVGAGNIESVFSILFGWGFKIKVLFDSDRAGHRSFVKLLSTEFFPDKESFDGHVFFVSETPNLAIEDLLATNEREVLKGSGGGKVLQAKTFYDRVKRDGYEVSPETRDNFSALFQRMGFSSR